MKYEIVDRGGRLEAYGAHSGYRIRMTSSHSAGVDSSWPVLVYVRGSESEDEIKVDVPKRRHASAAEAFDHGYECATLWIDAENRRVTHPRSAFGAPPQGGRVGRRTVPADCSSPTSASSVPVAGAASGPAEPGLPPESAGAQAVQADAGRIGAAAFAPRRPLGKGAARRR